MKLPSVSRLLPGCALIVLTTVMACRHYIPFATDDPNSGATGSTADKCDSTKIYFNQQVLPILVSNCAQSGCHDNGSHREGVALVSYQSVTQTGGVRPGNASGSKLYKEIASGSMPPRGYSDLTSEQKNIVYEWIQQGALNLVCENMCDSNSYTFSGAIKPLISNQCQGCHNTSNASGGIDLSTYAGVKASVDNGSFKGSVNWTSGFVQMPQSGSKLSDCQLTQINKWIAAGAPNN